MMKPVIFALLALLSAGLQAAEYFVATTGSNSNPGTELQPFATIGQGAAVAQAGDTVWIKPGTYQPNSPIRPANSGTSTSPIIFRAQAGGQVIIDGQTTVPTIVSREGLFFVSGKSWIIIDGLRVINSGFFGILIKDNSSNITVRNCSTFFTGASGICAATSSNIKVLNNTVQQACIAPGGSSVNTSECITIASVNTFEVAYNTVFDRMIDLNNGGEGIDAKNSCLNGTIHHNLVYDLVRLGIYVDAYAKNLSNVAVYANTVANCGSGITVASEVGAIVDGVQIYDNLIRDCRGGSGIRLAGYLDNGPLLNIDVYQNTVVRCGRTNINSWENCGLLVEADNPSNSNFNIRNNIFSDNTVQIRTKGQPYLTLDRNLLNGALQGGVTGTNAILANPQFVNAAANDFHLGSTSPAIDAVQGSPVSTSDRDGIPRGTPGDLGAFEWVTPLIGTSTTLTSSLNPALPGAAVTFTATVTSTSGTPTGSATFFNGAIALGSSALNGSGVATLNTSTLPLGIHSITASYTGSATYATSTSFLLTQTIDATPPPPPTVGYWRFEATPGFLADSAASSLTLSTQGTAPSDYALPSSGAGAFFPRMVPQSYMLNASAASVASGGNFSRPDSPEFTLASFTIEAYASRAATTTGTQYIASQFTTAGSQRSWGFGVAGTSPPSGLVAGELFLVLSNAGTGSTVIGSGMIVNQGEDYFLAASVEATNPSSGLIFYLRNLTTAATMATSTRANPIGTVYNSTGDFLIGSFNSGNSRWSGIIDEVRLSRTVLPPARLLDTPGLPAPTATSLVSSPSPVNVGATLTFTATITSPNGTPAGTVAFFDGTTQIGTGTLNPTGIASMQTSALAAGLRSITASYSATPSHASSTSPAVMVTINTVSLYQTWRSSYFTATDLQDPALEATLWGTLADPDADGSPNLLEYAFGTIPTAGNSAVRPVSGMNPSGRLTLTFPRIADPTLVYQVLGSSALSNWSNVWTSTGAQNTPGQVTVTDSASLPLNQRFLRLLVTLPAS